MTCAKTLAAVLVLTCCTSASSRTTAPNAVASPEIVSVASELFEAMQTRDRDALERLFVPEAQLYAVAGGERKASTREAFVEAITSSESELVERFWDSQVRVEGELATLWAAYDFHRDGEFSHCGHDAFQLVRVEGRWRIVHVLYTRRTEGCPASPLGPLEPDRR